MRPLPPDDPQQNEPLQDLRGGRSGESVVTASSSRCHGPLAIHTPCPSVQAEDGWSYHALRAPSRNFSGAMSRLPRPSASGFVRRSIPSGWEFPPRTAVCAKTSALPGTARCAEGGAHAHASHLRAGVLAACDIHALARAEGWAPGLISFSRSAP